ncbi:MAG: tRNA (guanosine(46)-N7)-methyltransferase TrmB [Verrucomicrobia bacterium]|nr:tRNA (guanosine(46)-N7)-methyltransferase TrmB [Verrucomicrobiota bacterium]
MLPSLHSTLIYRPRSYVERLDLSKLFPVARPLEVELGSGDGSFLAAYAQAHPEHNFLGVERLLGRLRKLDRKGQRLGLSNLKVIRLEATYVVEYLLPRESVRALHIYFPDPWPKRRHQARRLINPRFAEAARIALELGGKIYLRTDNTEYFAQMTEVFTGNTGYREIQTLESLSTRLTDFERDFAAKGVPTRRAAYERCC